MIFDKYFTYNAIDLKWGYVESIPEFSKLKECEQSKKWHGEGNVWNHTRKSVDSAVINLNSPAYNNLSVEEKRILVMGTLFHDIGKGVTTVFKNDDWHSYGHDVEGEKITRRILWDEDFIARERVCSLVRWHMEAMMIAEKNNSLERIMQLSYNYQFCWKDVLFVKSCDICGSIPEDHDETIRSCKKTEFVHAYAEKLGVLEHSPITDGSNFNLYALEEVKNAVFGKREMFKKRDILNTSFVTVLIGLPGAGKDTWLKTNSYYNQNVLCRDDIRVELGFCKEGDKIIGTSVQEEAVSEVFNKRLKEYIDSGKNVTINNLNVRRKYRDDYKHIINNPNVIWNYIYIEAPSLKDNFERRQDTMNPNIFNGIISKFDFPTADEYDNLEIVKQT